MFRKNEPQNRKIENKSIVKHAAKWLINLPKALFETKISHNSGTKFLSLALAVLFWFFVMDQVDPEITRVFENIPVQLTNTQELDQNNLKVMNQTDFFVNVEVTGRRNNVLSLNSKNIYLWADMRSVRSGLNNVFTNLSFYEKYLTKNHNRYYYIFLHWKFFRAKYYHGISSWRRNMVDWFKSRNYLVIY